MEPKLHSYFCYLNQGNPVVLEQEPENFNQLPCNYAALCPNSEIARMTYQTNLKIMRWRASDGELNPSPGRLGN